MKQCTRCREFKSLGEYYNYKASRDGKSYRCKSCDDKARYAYRLKHADKQKEMQRRRQLRYKYNIELEEYEEMLDKQGGKCAICGGDPVNTSSNNNKLVVDHCHETNVIRGLLCHRCNQALGLFKDSIENIKRAILYLKEDR